MANVISILIEAKDAASSAFKGISSQLHDIGTAADETTTKVGGFSAKSAAFFGIVAGAAQNLVFQGINMITGAVSDAAKRVDTLNNSNRTFENMGFSAEATKNMMHELDLSIRGLPTTLSDAVTGVELLTGSTNDISKSRKIFDALNDGIIGFGGSAVQVNGAIIQLSQAFSNGRVDAQTWNSLIQNGMGPALDALARKAGMTIGTFKDGLSTGKVSVGDFQDALIELDTKGGGGMSSLNKIAHDSTSGIETGIANARTAVTRGVADILTAIGTKNISNAIADIGKAFESIAKKIPEYVKVSVDFLKAHHLALSAVAGAIVALIIPVFVALGGAIVAAVAPLLPFIVIGAAVGAIAQVIATHLGGWHAVMKDLKGIIKPVADDVEDWFKKMGGLSGIIHIVRDDVFNFLGAVKNLWDAFKNSTVVTILVQFFQQVMVPALEAIWGSIVHKLWPALESLWGSFKKLWQEINPAFIEALKIAGAIVGGLFLAAIWLILAAINIFVDVLGFVIKVLSDVIGWIGNLIGWFGNLVGVVWNTIKTVADIFANLWPAVKDVIGLIVGLFGSLGGMILSAIGNFGSLLYNAGKSLISGLVNGIKDTVGAIGSAISGGVKGALHAAHIPGFASGTMSAPGGLAVVGESGPELVNLPRGSQVYTASQSRQMAGGTTNILSGNFTFNNKESVDAFFNRLDKTQRLASMGMA